MFFKNLKFWHIIVILLIIAMIAKPTRENYADNRTLGGCTWFDYAFAVGGC